MSEASIRLLSFTAVFLVVAWLQWRYPYRRGSLPTGFRWRQNLGIMLLDAAVVRFCVPLLAVGVAQYSQLHHIGLFNWFSVSDWVSALAGLLILDAAVYLQHRASHHIPWLWRLHRMHHSDIDFDVTTAVRFHPIEIVLSMVYKMLVVALFGIDPQWVIAFEIILNGTALFNHGNFSIPQPLEKALRWWVVTPDMHRIHHSVRPEETNSNYGFNLPWWDRLLGTYRAASIDPPQTMRIGLEGFRAQQDTRIGQLLAQPLKRYCAPD